MHGRYCTDVRGCVRISAVSRRKKYTNAITYVHISAYQDIRTAQNMLRHGRLKSRAVLNANL
jgi:hypothetical protein